MKAHRTDGVSLSFGLIFLAVTVWWAVAQVTTVRLPALGWLAAGALILFGVVGLFGAIRSGRHTEVPAQPAPAAPTGEETVGAPTVKDAEGDLTAETHAEIVRELLDDPAAAEPNGPEVAPERRPE